MPLHWSPHLLKDRRQLFSFSSPPAPSPWMERGRSLFLVLQIYVVNYLRPWRLSSPPTPLHLWRGVGGEEFIHRFIKAMNVLLIIDSSNRHGKSGVNVFYFSILSNENSCRKSKHLVEGGQRFRCLRLITCSGNHKVIIDAEFFFHLPNASAGILEIIFSLVCQSQNLNPAIPVLFIPPRKEFGFVHAIGAPGTEDLENQDLVFVSFVGRADFISIDVRKTEFQFFIPFF